MSLAEQMQRRTQDALNRSAQEEEKKIEVLMQTLKPLMDAAADEGQTYVEVLGNIDPDLFNYLVRERCKVSTSEIEGNPAYCVQWGNPSALPHTVKLVLASGLNELRQHTQKAVFQDQSDVGKRLKRERLLLIAILTLLADQGIHEVCIDFKNFALYEDTLREIEDLGVTVHGSEVLGNTYSFQW